jgi:1,4-alpha-glucan branching enzyme
MAPDGFPTHIDLMKPNAFQGPKAVLTTNSQTTKQAGHQENNWNAGLKLTPVRFEFTHPTAKAVYLAGSFNHWQPEARTLHSAGAGNWWEVTSLAPGTYEYCFVVDGQWVPDPRASESVANPFGGRNSVLHVAIALETAHPAGAGNLPSKNETRRHPPML